MSRYPHQLPFRLQLSATALRAAHASAEAPTGMSDPFHYIKRFHPASHMAMTITILVRGRNPATRENTGNLRILGAATWTRKCLWMMMSDCEDSVSELTLALRPRNPMTGGSGATVSATVSVNVIVIVIVSVSVIVENMLSRTRHGDLMRILIVIGIVLKSVSSMIGMSGGGVSRDRLRRRTTIKTYLPPIKRTQSPRTTFGIT